MFYKKGVTLIELMITMAIAAILMMIGVPGFRSSIANSRMTTSANELVAVINLARSEAIKRGSQVTIRRKGANSGQWEAGWDVFVDLNGNEIFNDDGDTTLCETGEECVLKTYARLPTGFTLRPIAGGTFNDYIAYQSTGLSTSSAGETFRLCDSSADIGKSREITINSIGRPRVSKGTAACP